MRHNVVFILTLAAVLPACASCSPASKGAPGSLPMPICRIEGVLTVGADPYAQPRRQKNSFGADLNSAGVLPIQVMVKNDGERKVLVRPSDMLLVLPDGSRINPVGASEAAVRVDTGARGAAVASQAGPSKAPVSGDTATRAQAARIEDFKRKELQESRLDVGQSARGFVYFIPPAAVGVLEDAVLVVQFVDTEDACSQAVEVPLGRIELRGGPEAAKRTAGQ